MSEVLGIDVSHYQKTIDWAKVAAADKKFAIMKAMYEAQSHRKDETFEANYKGAGDYGIDRGVYIFIASASIADPVADAKALLKHLNGRKLEYGIWLDLESDVLRAKGKEFIRNLCYIYAYHFTMAGYFVGIYCNRDWYLNVIHDDLKNDFDFWIARYPAGDNGSYNPASTLKPNGSYAVAWQYSSKGSVPGVPTKCDLDVDYDGITKLDYKTSYKKDINKIAHEVLEGKWGTKDTVPTRKERLEAAGYDYTEVQNKVNELVTKGL